MRSFRLFGAKVLMDLGLAAVVATPVLAQPLQRPDAGTLQESQRQIPLLPQTGAPAISLPEVRLPAVSSGQAQITPSAFRFEGNMVFNTAQLSALLADRVNQPTNLAGLAGAAAAITRYYRAQGYLLTEAYLPEQSFRAEGGAVTIAIIEARIGRVRVQVKGDQGSASFAQRVVNNNLLPGSLINEYQLDKPVLLLRDLAGMEASATVTPGERTGLADVTVEIQPGGTRVEGAVSVDNFGARSAGPLHATLDLKVSNLLGRGDVLDARAQASDAYRSNVYRVAYSLPLAPDGTRVSLSAARADYTLGRQFAALGASGVADIFGLTFTRPLIRSRDNNVYALLGFEHKKLFDQIATPANESERRISAVRFGLLGNMTDDALSLQGASSYALSTSIGRTRMDAVSLGLDQGLGGLQTAGRFSKFNLEAQRTQFLGGASSLHLNLQAQLASKNLASAEKMALGGPTGVRAYPVGEGIGDAGLLVSLEYRYQLAAPVMLAGEPVSLAAFYDHGTVKFNQDAPAVAGSNRVSLGGVGLGVLAGRINNFLVSAYLAWRTTPATPTTGDPDRAPRAWVSAQKWF